MKPLAPAVVILFLLAGCGTETSDAPDLDMIRDRLNRNACRMIREELVFQMGELEFRNDSTYSAIPGELLPESLLICPVTTEAFEMLVDGDDRMIRCPSGHGETRF
ncbi:MAG TPA: hypothetical protein PLM22_06490 [Candidatus Sabulitectum sp.]|nr:hypothetical protein [Candidatus Sabulitectum sp.]HPF31683.1 hypothetical protein [Candidatus Sabulitectum sp.]HPJ28565.1 hypothetical protein [Candidatus Sabulitectum sp.]HPR22930.1 hypothetical protein [Candidatus Sabulitectum sp.]